MAAVTITEYTDPGCPFAFSAEPFRRRLQWLFGDQLEWRPRMVVLADTPEEYLEKGFTTERQSSSFETLSREHGMPIDTRLRPRMAATAPACRAVVAARLFAPEAEPALLRRLRVRHFSAQLLDDPGTIADAAVDAGIDPAELTQWLDRPEVGTALQEDKAAARAPTPAALAQPHKLAQWPGGMRYTCPSYEIEGLSVPGFQPWAAYEVALANVAPGLEKRDPPSDVAELLRWAGTPLATREVAEVCEISDWEARQALGRVAVESHVGADGFWSLTD
jgi:predicted DsbA family dithiol-disulfide isomerase